MFTIKFLIALFIEVIFYSFGVYITLYILDIIIKNVFKINYSKYFSEPDKLQIILIISLILVSIKTFYFSTTTNRTTFDSSQCEMYSYGFIHSGQMFKIHTTSGDLFIMFSDSPDTPVFFRNRGVYSWTTRDNFLELLPNIFKFLNPYTSNRFSQLLDKNRYVGLVSEDFKKLATGADNKCY